MRSRGIFIGGILLVLFFVSTMVVCLCLYTKHFGKGYFIDMQIADCKTVPINTQVRVLIKDFLDKVFIAKEPYTVFKKQFSSFYKDVKHMCNNVSQSFVKKLFKEILICKNLRRVCKEALCVDKIKQGIFNRYPRSNLNWCEDCYNARKETRVYLMLVLMDKLAQQKDKSKEIQYVSFGAGSLLQDYLILTSLIRLGFSNIQVHVIDILYNKARGLKEFGGAYWQLDRWRAGTAKALKSFKTLLCRAQGGYGSCVKIHTYTTHMNF